MPSSCGGRHRAREWTQAQQSSSSGSRTWRRGACLQQGEVPAEEALFGHLQLQPQVQLRGMQRHEINGHALQRCETLPTTSAGDGATSASQQEDACGLVCLWAEIRRSWKEG